MMFGRQSSAVRTRDVHIERMFRKSGGCLGIRLAGDSSSSREAVMTAALHGSRMTRYLWQGSIREVLTALNIASEHLFRHPPAEP